jgi:hypothetical protein
MAAAIVTGRSWPAHVGNETGQHSSAVYPAECKGGHPADSEEGVLFVRSQQWSESFS